jgi:hypothetical protein
VAKKKRKPSAKAPSKRGGRRIKKGSGDTARHNETYSGQVCFQFKKGKPKRGSPSGPLKVLADYTFLCGGDEGREYLKKGEEAAQQAVRAGHFGSESVWHDGTYSELEASVQQVFESDVVAEVSGARILACKCFGGRMVSVTVRHSCKDGLLAKLQEHINKGGSSSHSYELDFAKAKRVFAKSEYKASDDTTDSYPVSIESIVETLRREVFYGGKKQQNTAPDRDRLHGAVLILGRTKSAKSKIMRGLVHSLLSHQKTYESIIEEGRRPHLVTCEDPVEILFRKPVLYGDHRTAVGIDYTPRDRTKGDYKSLKCAFRNALRQTPTCFIVGEIREPAELKDTIDFAGTGHLVIATMHAGSLIDAFEKIFEATNARLPADRGLVGQRLLAVVHLEAISVTDNKKNVWNVVVPALWRRSPSSTAALVASGIGSLVPHNSTASGRTEQGGRTQDCIGRRWFAESLTEKAEKKNEALRMALIKQAALRDLQGT